MIQDRIGIDVLYSVRLFEKRLGSINTISQTKEKKKELTFRLILVSLTSHIVELICKLEEFLPNNIQRLIESSLGM